MKVFDLSKDAGIDNIQFAFGTTKRSEAVTDVGKMEDIELVALLEQKNDWWVRQARKTLQERGGNKLVVDFLEARLLLAKDPTRRLRYLWTLHSMEALTEGGALTAMNDPDEYVRGWGIQLGLEKKSASPRFLARMAVLAEK